MSAATTRLAEATIDVCARLAMAEEEKRRDTAEIDRLRRELTLANETADEQIGDLLQELAYNEKRLGIDGAQKRSPMQRFDTIVDKLKEEIERTRNAQQNAMLRVERVLAHYEKCTGVGTSGPLHDRLVQTFTDVQKHAITQPSMIGPPLPITPCACPCKVPRGGKFCTVCGDEPVPF